MKIRTQIIGVLFLLTIHLNIKAQQSFYYEVKTYFFKSTEQEQALDSYLQSAFIPALHKIGMGPVGVYKPIANDTAVVKKIIVINSHAKLKSLSTIEEKLLNDPVYKEAAKDYLNIMYNNPSYIRIEKTWLKAFKMAPKPILPKLNKPLSDHVYELRSYESPSESYYRNKVHMFNEGGEVTLFKNLNFNAVFYGDVIAGAHMPNLMYMTCFENMEDRNEHWKNFSTSPVWKKLSSDPFYKNNVSRNETILMRAAGYSEY